MVQTVTFPQALELLREQQENWVMAGDNYRALQQVRVKELYFDTFRVNVQFNPARLISSAAKVDAKSIQERKCFLCPVHLPQMQVGLPFDTNYQVLVNPFPIFPQHLTIPTLEHTDQRILPRYGTMLDLAQALDRFTIFYNGPKCGASAPDHAHFQAGNRGFLPIEKEWKSINRELLYNQAGTSLYVLTGYLRQTLIIESESREGSVRLFEKIYRLLPVKSSEVEPMINLLTWYEKGWWTTCLFPREKHRPNCYTAAGEENILISPASVDFGGVFITPLEKDFDKITAEDVQAILQEVSLSAAEMDVLMDRIKKEV